MRNTPQKDIFAKVPGKYSIMSIFDKIALGYSRTNYEKNLPFADVSANFNLTASFSNSMIFTELDKYFSKNPHKIIPIIKKFHISKPPE